VCIAKFSKLGIFIEPHSHQPVLERSRRWIKGAVSQQEGGDWGKDGDERV
jgi:hypothetical protein